MTWRARGGGVCDCDRIARDDHDFGMNNAGGEWSEKVFAQKAFLDFLGEPAASPRRKREGVYESYTFRGLGRHKNRSVRLILLDLRYKMSRERGVLMGEDQWSWLETLLAPRDSRDAGEEENDAAPGKKGKNEKKKNKKEKEKGGQRSTLTEGEMENRDADPVDVTLLVSSIQVHADAQRLLEGLIDGVESWGQFPREKRRLMDLVEQSDARVIFLSGDIHHSEIGTSPAGCELPYELVELTSSGMTHGITDELTNKYGLRWYARNVIPDMLPEFIWPAVGRLRRPRFIRNSFAEVAIDFEDSGGDSGGGGVESKSSNVTGSIRLNVRDINGRIKISKIVKLTDLEGTRHEEEAEAEAAGVTGQLSRRHRDECKTEKDLTKWERYRLPFLAGVILLVQPVIVVVAMTKLYCAALKQLREHHKTD